MLLLLAPAKTQDFQSPCPPIPATCPRFQAEADRLVKALRKLGPPRLAKLMNLSDALTERTLAQLADWDRAGERPALFAYAGEAFAGLEARSLPPKALAFAQEHLRILSGLYGLLRPFDALRPYRLEMAARLATPGAKDLCAFWEPRLTAALAEDLQGRRVVLNLASREFTRALRPEALPARWLTCAFQEASGRVVSFHAKRARGLMARFVLQNGLEDPEGLKSFTGEGYRFQPKASTPGTWLFRREA